MLAHHLIPLLIAALASAQQRPAEPTFGGVTLDEWRTRLSSNDLSHTDTLIAGGAQAVPLLRVLIRSREDYVPWRAIHACGEIGAAAAPLGDDLLAILRDEDDLWIKQEGAVTALRKLGRDDLPFRRQLARIFMQTDVPALRSTCWRALAELQVDMAARILADRSLSSERFHALFAHIGEAGIPALVDALAGTERNRRLAERELVEIGWPAVRRLESAGHPELAQRILERHPLTLIPLHDRYELHTKNGRPFSQPPCDRIPQMTWWRIDERGQRLRVFRASDGPRGLEVHCIQLRQRRGKPDADTLELTATTIPRVRALAAVRQLQALAQLELREDPDILAVDGHHRSRTFMVGVQIEAEGDAAIDAEFVGFSHGHNAAERFEPEAASAVLHQLLQGHAPTPRRYTDADDALVERMRTRAKVLTHQLQRVQELARRARRKKQP